MFDTLYYVTPSQELYLNQADITVVGTYTSYITLNGYFRVWDELEVS